MLAGPRAGKPPQLECEQGRKWRVENHVGNHNVVIDQTTNQQTVYIYRCDNCTVQVRWRMMLIGNAK